MVKMSFGYRRYDDILKRIIVSISNNASREELVEIFLNEVYTVTNSDGIAAFEIIKESETADSNCEVVCYDQVGINRDRWLRFKNKVDGPVDKSSIVYKVLVDRLDIEIWNSMYYKDEFSFFGSLYDVSKGGWLTGLHLPRGSAKSTYRGIFLWYTTGQDESILPMGAEQDLRILKFFQYCYDLATFNIRKSARSIIKQRQELLSMLSPSIFTHEINNRINHFSNNLYLLKDKAIGILKEYEDACQFDKSMINDLVHIVDDILLPNAERLYKISHSIMGLTRRIASGVILPADEIESAVDLMSHSANSKGIVLQYKRYKYHDKIKISTDPALFMHVLVNLISNSIEGLDIGENTKKRKKRNIWIRLHKVEKNDDQYYICVDILDNGKGIDVSQKEKIFEAGITTKKMGHGLGLSICKMILGYLGGEIKLINLKCPTTFRILLPEKAPKASDLEEEIKNEIESIYA